MEACCSEKSTMESRFSLCISAKLLISWMNSSKLLDLAKIQSLDLKNHGPYCQKAVSGRFVREGEEMAVWGYTDLIFTSVLGVRDLLNSVFSCRKWTVCDLRSLRWEGDSQQVEGKRGGARWSMDRDVSLVAMLEQFCEPLPASVSSLSNANST